MAYTPTQWVNGKPPALNAENLNKLEAGIQNNDAEINSINADLGKLKSDLGKIEKFTGVEVNPKIVKTNLAWSGNAKNDFNAENLCISYIISVEYGCKYIFDAVGHSAFGVYGYYDSIDFENVPSHIDSTIQIVQNKALSHYEFVNDYGFKNILFYVDNNNSNPIVNIEKEYVENDVLILNKVNKERVLKSVEYIRYSDASFDINSNYEASVYFENGTKMASFNVDENSKYIINPVGEYNRFWVGFRKNEDNEIINGTKMDYHYNFINAVKPIEINTQNYKTIYVYLVSNSSSINPQIEVNKVLNYVDNDVLIRKKNIEGLQDSVTIDISKEIIYANASFNISNDVWNVHFENGCRIAMFHMEENKTYDISINGQFNRFRIGFCKNRYDNILNGTTFDETIDYYGTGDSVVYDNKQYKTAYVYLVASDNSLKPTITVKTKISLLNDSIMIDDNNIYGLHDYKKCVNESISLIGTPWFYFSESTSNEHVSINNSSIDELYGIYDNLVSRFPNIIKRGEDLGNDSSGLPIRQYVIELNDPKVLTGEVTLQGTMSQSLVNAWNDKCNNKIIALATGCHGNEKVPTYGVALAIKDLVESSEQWAIFIKSNFTVKIIPCMNPYGYDKNHRLTYDGNNINRDCVNFNCPETRAWKKWIDSDIENTITYIDAHGTSGYYAYFEYVQTDKHLYDYEKMCMRFTTAIQSNWSEYFGNDKYPYCYACRSEYDGMTINYTSENGIIGHIFETPQDIINGETGGWDNDLRMCKITKDMVINAMQIYGKMGYLIN